MANSLRPVSLQELNIKYLSSPNTNTVHRQQLSRLEKLAIIVTDRIGTMGFFLIILFWTVGWLGWNILAPAHLRFDPYPAFVLWLFISNLIQIHLMPLLLIGQNIQGRHAQLRAEHDYATDKKAEKEIEAILLHLENQNQLMLQILQRLDRIESTK